MNREKVVLAYLICLAALRMTPARDLRQRFQSRTSVLLHPPSLTHLSSAMNSEPMDLSSPRAHEELQEETSSSSAASSGYSTRAQGYSPPTRSGVEFELYVDRFAVTDDTLYVLFPTVPTYCSAHHKHITLKPRLPNEVMMHLVSRSHMNKMNEAKTQSEPLAIVGICEYCVQQIPISAAKGHMRMYHGKGMFADGAAGTDLNDLRVKDSCTYGPISQVLA